MYHMGKKLCKVLLHKERTFLEFHKNIVYQDTELHIHANTHRNTYTHAHISHPIQTSLRSQHLPLSKPAVSNINYPQDVFTLCVDPNTSDSIAVPMPHTLLKGCLVNLNPANPPWPPAAGMTLPPSFTPSVVLIRLIYYAP